MVQLGFGLYFLILGSGFAPTGSSRSNPTSSGSTQSNSARLSQHELTWSTQLTRSTQPSGSTFRREDLEYCRMHASESHLGNDTTKS
ncbi:hypothetical protein Hanom_Chr17g01547041 [Helianthus anomalus]